MVMDPAVITAETVITRSEDALEATVDGDVVLMSLERGNYYGLDPIGGDIWGRLAEPVRFDALCSGLLDSYDAAPEVLEKDVRLLLARLSDEGLIAVT